MKTMTLKIHIIICSFFMFCISGMSVANEPLIPAKSPTSASKVKEFSFQLLFAVYDFDYKNILERQQNAATMFSGPGWQTLQKAFTKSQLLQSITKNKYTVSTTPLRPPQITQEGLNTGVYYWIVEFPAMLLFKNESYQQVQYVNIKIVLAYKNKIQAQALIVTKGKPVLCEQTSNNITVTEPSAEEKATTAKKTLKK